VGDIDLPFYCANIQIVARNVRVIAAYVQQSKLIARVSR
jgi:hypothetical protein